MSEQNWKTSCHHMSVCALTGASAFFASIPGSFMLINGPLWCYFYAMMTPLLFAVSTVPSRKETPWCTEQKKTCWQDWIL